jgi:hypothetical protein
MELQVQYAKSRPLVTLGGPGEQFPDRSGGFPSKTDCPAMRIPPGIRDAREAGPVAGIEEASVEPGKGGSG